MINKKKITSYALYGLGEIMLIVVGILLAVQIGNWNENKKNETSRQKLLKALKIEFISNKNQLDTIFHYNQRVVDASIRLLKMFEAPPQTFDKEQMALLVQDLDWTWTFDPKNGALRSGISSGDINLIKSDSLSYYLFDWEDIVIDLDENETRAVDHLLASWPVISKYLRSAERGSTSYTALPSSVFESDYYGFVRDPYVEDFLSKRYIWSIDVITELKSVREHNLKILELIDHELIPSD